MKSIVAVIAALAVTIVSAQSSVVIPHSPTLNQVLTAGQTTTIAWTPVAGVDTISTIDLLQGAATSLQPVTGGHVASNVQSSLGTYTWTVPATLASGTDYALSFGTSPNVSYTPYFTIQAASGASGSSSAAVSSAASSAASSAVSSVSSSAVSSSASSSAVSSAASSATAPSSSTHESSSASSAKASSNPTTFPSAAAIVNSSGANKNTAAVGVLAAAVVAAAVVAALV